MNHSPNIGFIVGVGRSGTTLIAALLNRHPEICVLPETGFFVHLRGLPGGHQGLADDWPDSMHALAEKMQRNATPTWNPRETARILTAKLPQFPGIRDLFQDFCATIAQVCGKTNVKWILEKTPDHMLCAAEIQSLFPDSPLLHIIRDGRAVAESRSRMTFLPPDRRDLEFNILDWAWRMREIRPLLARHDKLIEFSYETLVRHPQRTLHTLLDFLYLDYDSDLLQPQGNEDHLIEIGMRHKDGVKRTVDPNLAEAWRSRIPPERQKQLEHLAGKQLHELNYPLHHLRLKQTRTALIPEVLATRPGLWKRHKATLLQHLTESNSVTVGTYGHLDTVTCVHDIYTLDPIDPARIREIGSLCYFRKLLKLRLCLKLKGRRIHSLSQSRRYAFRQWPLGWTLETLIPREKDDR